jgi:hypothetical protein
LRVGFLFRFAETKTPMSNKQQTAVDLMFQKAISVLPMGSIDARRRLKETYEQAKEMEKDKMENLWDAAISHGGCKCYDEIMTFEEYYNETFNK